MTSDPADLDFEAIERIAERDTDPALLAVIRERVAAILLVGPRPSEPTDERERVIANFVDQFVIDVSGIDDTLRQPLFEQLGSGALGFVQALYVTDLGIRRRIVLDRLGETVPDAVPADGNDMQLWPALEQYMRTVAKMQALDPATSELVRLRGAAAHQCRICQSRLSVKAIEALGTEAPFIAVVSSQPTELSERHAAALRFVDAIVTQPTELDASTVADLREYFSPAEVHEMIHDIVRNSTNKFAVAVGGDAPVVAEGFEYFDIDADGDVVADVDAEVVRAATRV